MASLLLFVTTKFILPMHSHIPVPVPIPWGRRNEADMVLSQANRRKVESRGAHTGVQVNLKHVPFSADSFFPAQGWTGNLVCHQAVLAMFWVQKAKREAQVSSLNDTYLVRGEKRYKSRLPETQSIDSDLSTLPPYSLQMTAVTAPYQSPALRCQD